MRLWEKAARPVRAGRAVAFGRIEIGAGESSVAGWAESNPRLPGFDDVVITVGAGAEIDLFRRGAAIDRHGICERVEFDELGFIEEELISVDEGIGSRKDEYAAREEQQGHRSGKGFEHIGLAQES